MELTVREASPSDLDEFLEFDRIARDDPDRAGFLRRAIESGDCLVAERDGRTLGYSVLDYSFYGHGFIPLVYVRPDSRRHGVGSVLVRSLEARCVTPKLFTSTNESNAPMRALLSKLGFAPSGIIHNLDPGDAEIVFFKRRTITVV